MIAHEGRFWMRATSAGLLLACALGTACAQEMTLPRVSTAPVDWDAVQADLANSEVLRPLLAGAGASALTRLNGAAARIFPSVARSAVPVLLPVDLPGLLQEPGQAIAPQADG